MGEVKKKQQSPNKLLNAISTFLFIRKNREVDALTISEKLGIALPTLYRSIKYLLEKKLIIEDGKGISSAGRRANLYSINPSYAYILGICIGKKYITAFIAGIDGNIRTQHTVELMPGLQLDEILAVFHEAVDTVVAQHFGSKSNIACINRIGIMSASAIDMQTGTITEFAGRECLNGFPIVDHVQSKYNKPVKLMKESSICALSYADEMADKHISHYLYVHIGHGVSASLVADGQLYGGKHGSAGEIEKMVMNGDWCSIFQNAPLTLLEVYEKVEQFLHAHPASKLSETVLQKCRVGYNREAALLSSINEAVAKQDPDCIDILKDTVEKWRMVIRILAVCYDPECCIIGGDISDDVMALYRWICRELETLQISFLPGHAGKTNHAVLARSILDDVFADLQNDILAM